MEKNLLLDDMLALKSPNNVRYKIVKLGLLSEVGKCDLRNQNYLGEAFSKVKRIKRKG